MVLKRNEMDKPEQNYKELIAKEIREILALERNKKSAALFWEKLNNISPKSCTVKSGMAAGEGIDFLLAFEKGGDNKPFDLFIDNIPEASLRYGFIFGLCPNTFNYNPQFSISDDTHDFVKFKLIKNGK